MDIRIVIFAVFAFAHAHCSKFVTVSRHINGYVPAVSDSHVFIVKINETNDGHTAHTPRAPLTLKFSLVAYRKAGTSFGTAGIEIVSPDSKPHDYFGTRIAFNRKFVVISAIGYEKLRGAVYIYSIGKYKFTFKQKLLAGGGRAGDLFGRHLAINDNNEIVVCSRYNGIHVFAIKNSKWTLVQKLQHTTEGSNVDITTNHIAIGGKRAKKKGYYIYTRGKGTWTVKQMLHPLAENSSPNWIKMSENRLVIGDTVARKVYEYRLIKDTWGLTDIITGSGYSCCGGSDYFGRRVDVYDNVLVVPASRFAFNSSLTKAGLVYIFQFDTKRRVWEEKVRLTASDVSDKDGFGDHVVIGRNFVFVHGENRRGTYVYEYKPSSATATHGRVWAQTVVTQIFILLFCPGAYFFNL